MAVNVQPLLPTTILLRARCWGAALLSLFCLHSYGADTPMVVRVEAASARDNPVVAYRIELAQKALNASGKHYTIESCNFPAGQTSDARARDSVRNQHYCDVIATSAGGKASRELSIVPVPLYLGGGGYRVFMANQHGHDRAAKVRSLAELRKLSIGSGPDWIDSNIMLDSGLNLVQAEYIHLFSMLAIKRFDLLTRAIYEVTGEFRNIGLEDGIVLEPRLMLHYPNDLFFYVAPERKDLQEDLYKGMKILYCNGELQRHISQHYSTRSMRTLVRPERRLVFELPNKYLSRTETWALQTFTSAPPTQPLRKGAGGKPEPFAPYNPQACSVP